MRAAAYAGFREEPLSVPLSQWYFLAERFQRAVRKQPQIAQLRRRLRSIGGEMLVPAPSDVDHDIETMLQQGRVMTGRVALHEMAASRCHQNVAQLWLSRFESLVALCTGYALSEDGLWRQHSWGLLADGILETTSAREIYFGIQFPAEITDAIANHTLGE